MLYGDLVTLLPQGIQLNPKAMLPIGIFDDSRCFGVWVEDASRTQHDQLPHLVVSPLHPDVWPFLLRIELKLKDSPGAMAGAAEILAESKLNIQFGESSPSGHHHATWNLVCEAVDLRQTFTKRITALRDGMDGRPSRTRINRLANSLADAMYSKAAEVQAALEAGNFLHPRIKDRKLFLVHDPERMDAALRTRAVEDLPRAVRIRWIQNLALFAFYGSRVDDCIPFTYDQRHSLLRSTGRTEFPRILRESRVDSAPTKAIASIYPEEHHVRFIPLQPGDLEQYVQIDLRYDASFTRARRGKDSGGQFTTTRGLWADVCAKLKQDGINLLRVTNKTIHHEPQEEHGVLTLIGRHPHGILDAARLSERLRQVPELPGRTLKAGPPVITALGAEKVFISRRMNGTKAKELLELAQDTARACGLEPLRAEDDAGEQLTDTVKRKIRDCAGLFQIITLSLDERDRRNEQRGEAVVRPEWLIFEYGYALGAGKHLRRVMDTANLADQDATVFLSIGADEVVPRFDRDKWPETVDCFTKVMQNLADAIRHRAPA